MQKAKDSFLAALQSRLAQINPERTVVIDGQLRPGILVCENEVPGLDRALTDVFCLEWGEPQLLCANSAYAPSVLNCTVNYRTMGTGDSAGIDRGRLLAKMDEELGAMLDVGSVQKTDFTCEPAADLGTKVFWGTPKFGATELDGDEARRTATVAVCFFPEAKQ